MRLFVLYIILLKNLLKIINWIYAYRAEEVIIMNSYFVCETYQACVNTVRPTPDSGFRHFPNNTFCGVMICSLWTPVLDEINFPRTNIFFQSIISAAIIVLAARRGYPLSFLITGKIKIVRIMNWFDNMKWRKLSSKGGDCPSSS